MSTQQLKYQLIQNKRDTVLTKQINGQVCHLNSDRDDELREYMEIIPSQQWPFCDLVNLFITP